MSVAEKTLLLKQDFDEVYDQGYEDGKNSVFVIDKYATALQIPSLNIFTTPEVELNLDNIQTLSSFCAVKTTENTNTTVEHLIINAPDKITSMQNSFICDYAVGDNTLKRITLNFDTKNIVQYQNCFSCNFALEEIDGQPLNFSSVSMTSSISTSNVFNYCANLKEVRFVANSIPKKMVFSACLLLSDTSIQSIIDGLADLTGGTAQTLTLHADVGAKLTDEQKATITAKNWTLVY